MRTRDERGSLTLFFVVIALALLFLVGLVVDGGGKIRALQQADAVAAEAARTAGQQINGPAAVRGEAPSLDVVAARQAALDYIRAAGASGSVSGGDATHLTVTVTTHYKPVFLSLMGMPEQSETGRANVTLVRGIDGPE